MYIDRLPQSLVTDVELFLFSSPIRAARKGTCMAFLCGKLLVHASLGSGGNQIAIRVQTSEYYSACRMYRESEADISCVRMTECVREDRRNTNAWTSMRSQENETGGSKDDIIKIHVHMLFQRCETRKQSENVYFLDYGAYPLKYGWLKARFAKNKTNYKKAKLWNKKAYLRFFERCRRWAFSKHYRA